MRRRLLPTLILLVSAVAAAQVVRTGDPVKRGLSETDFPRIQTLAEGVYSYEQLRSAGAETFTTVSLFVVSDVGVRTTCTNPRNESTASAQPIPTRSGDCGS